MVSTLKVVILSGCNIFRITHPAEFMSIPENYFAFTFFSYLCNTMKEKENDIKPGRSLFSKLMNKYTVTLFIFLVWLAFFDRNNLVEKMQLHSKITTLKKEKAYYQEKIEDDNRKMQELLSNRDNLEKFAREQYLMKKPNEDIFVIVNE